MFTINDNFTSYNQNRIPYTFSVERHTETANLHAGVTKDGFSLKSIGNRFILNSPEFENAVFKTELMISYPLEIDPCFRLIFGYDKKSRTGNAVQITYHIEEKALSAVLVAVENGQYTCISEVCKQNWFLPVDRPVQLSLEISDGKIDLKADDAEFLFTSRNTRGNFAIDRDAFIGELIIKSISFVTEDDFEKESIIKTPPLKIPMINGGDIPYTIQYDINKINDEYYMTATLDGGTQSRDLNKSERAGQYVAEIDYMDTPYVGLYDKDKEALFNLAMGEKCFVDPNIFWDCQKDFFGNIDLPIISLFKLDGFTPSANSGFIFGYNNLSCKGYAQQSGGREFRFSSNGSLIYQGGALNGADIYELQSPPDKKAISLISESSAEYKNIINHLKTNHYFSVDEDITFCLLFRTETDTDFLSFNAEIRNVFETEVLAKADVTFSVDTWMKAYTEIKAEANFKPLPVGVYKIIYTILYGGKEYKTISHAFEVYDSAADICPPLASDLPFMFTMNNEQKNLPETALTFQILFRHVTLGIILHAQPPHRLKRKTKKYGKTSNFSEENGLHGLQYAHATIIYHQSITKPSKMPTFSFIPA